MKLYIPPPDLFRYWWKTRKHFRKIHETGPDSAPALEGFALEGDLPCSNGTGVFFTACDSIYFELYASNYVESIGASGGRQSIHLHIYDASDAQLERARALGNRHGVAVTATRDAQPAPALYSAYYYAAGRFVLMPALLRAARSPVVCTDIDVLVRRSFDASVAALHGHDVSLHLRPESSLPWRKVLASTVIGMPTDAAQGYFSCVAATLAEILAAPLSHHVDQIVLYFAYRACRGNGPSAARFATMQKCMVDWDFEESSLVWNAKGPQRKDAYWAAARAAGLDQSGVAER